LSTNFPLVRLAERSSVNENDGTMVAAKPLGSAGVARWAGTVGIALPAMTLVVYPIWSFPGTQTSGSELARWASTHHDRLVVTMLLNTVGVTLWLIFGAAVWTYLRD